MVIKSLCREKRDVLPNGYRAVSLDLLMRLLAMDIGGTNSRFADCHYQSNTDFTIEQSFSIKTNQSGINSFQDLINAYETNRPNSFLNISEYHIVSIAIAGPVNGNQSSPPNIAWDVNLDDYPTLPETFLLNDFVAQATAFSIPEQQQKLVSIRVNNKCSHGASAVIGAGTGLGHCMLLPVEHQKQHYQVIASEAGQAGFIFTTHEKQLQSFILDKIKQPFATNDHIVSGSGLSLIHEFLTNKFLPAKEVFSDTNNNQETLELFSRFYARACRNFCLSSGITDKLIITGGIAAKHPRLINNEHFLDEFTHSNTHQKTLQQISIYLNQEENIGLFGACFFALFRQ